jgi:tyrosine-protein kinase Etk/Wzc
VNNEISVMDQNAEAMAVAEEDGLGMIDLLLILAARKKSIAGITVACTAIAAAVAFVLPNVYTATAVIMPPQQPQTAVSGLLGQLGPLAAVAGKDIGLKSPSDLYVGLLSGRTIADHLIDRFRLKTLYEAKTMTDARSKFHNHTRTSSGKDSLIRIEVDDEDPQRAADIANAFVVELNTQNTAFGTTEAVQRRIFLEKQLADVRSNLASAEETMKKTQTRTGILQVEAQTSVAIASIAQLKAQITAGEVGLQRLSMGATAQNPEVLRIEAELDALRSQLKKAESAPRAAGDPMLAPNAMPGAGLEYLRSLRELKYQEFLFEMLSKQYEAARIDENKIAPALQLVDAAVPPDKKSGPHRGLMILFGAVAGLMMSCIGIYVLNGTRDPGTREKLRLLNHRLFHPAGRNGSVASV